MESQFVRHICIMEFTGQWCAKCPQGFNLMNYVLSSFDDAETHVIALHDNSSGQDEFAEPLQPTQLAIFRAFALTGYPSFIIDLRDGGSLSGSSAFKDFLKETPANYPAHCGVAVKSTYDQTSGQADIAVRLTSEKSETYRIAVFVVEDKIVAKQNDGGTIKQDYTHRHVGRQMLSASYKGDSLGTVEAGKEVTKNYSLTVDSAWNLENTTIYALGISADGYVNNMAVCQIVNGDTDYDYIKE